MPQNKRYIQKSTRFAVFKRDSFTCRYCGRQVPEVTLELEHVTPFSQGGSTDEGNLVTSCRECNAGKREVELDEILPPRKGATEPPPRDPAPWEDFLSEDESDRLLVLRRRIWLIEERRKETQSEVKAMMRRAIMRGRRKRSKGILT